MSIAAVMTAITSTGVMAFDADGCSTCPNDGPILVQNELTKLAGYQGNILPAINGLAENTPNPHLPVQSIGDLALSSNGLGDALIFPMFNQANGWGTEFVVRNTDQNRAIVAKVAVHAADDSEEILDFNVYLSAADVVRFKIENGNITSEDGSILREFPAPSSNLDDVTNGDFASVSKPFSRPVPSDSGYVVVYGMAQASTEADPLDHFDQRYHRKHYLLFKNYRAELDACRPGWRIGHQNAMENGTYTRHTTHSPSVENYSVAAPNQATNCTFTSTSPLYVSVMEAGAAAAAASSLASQVIDQASATAAADAAKAAADAASAVAAAAASANNSAAVAAQTAATMAAMAAAVATTAADADPAPSTPTEFHAITIAVNNAAIAVAGAAAAVSSAATTSAPGNFFGDVDASLTGTVRLYNATNGARDMILPAKSIENFTSGNKIIWTEGEIAAFQDRRIQGTSDESVPAAIAWAKYNEAGIRADARAFLVNNTSYNFAADSIANQLVITQPYKRVLVQLGNDDGYWQDTDDNFGGFSFVYNVYNENESIDNIPYTESPHNSGITILMNELQVMENLEEGSDFDGENGFALLRFTNINGQNSGIPAIVTQMIGTTVGGAPQVNWIYSQTR